MYANSPLIESTQSDVHPRLLQVLQRHRQHRYQRPYAAHALAAYSQMRDWLKLRPSSGLILDSGCGTGESSALLAERFPECNVVGIDQSATRLGKIVTGADNLLRLRAPLEDIWRLLLQDRLHPLRHYLWYPNPWPKPEHLMRRWHAHPVLPELLQLGGELELRSNWRVYANEFAQTLGVFGYCSQPTKIHATAAAVSPFERKYRDSRHDLWQVRVELS